MSTPFIPFSCWPGHWGLKGTTRDLAKAEYELEGYELEVAKAMLQLTGNELAIRLNVVSNKYGKIDDDAFQQERIRLTYTGPTMETKLARHEHNMGRISDVNYEKQLATINGEPWVSVLSIAPEGDKPGQGSMELDWNDLFVEHLEEAGYKGAEPEELVDAWLSELCKNIALEQYSGVGDFDEQVQESSDGGMRVQRNRREDGKTEIK